MRTTARATKRTSWTPGTRPTRTMQSSAMTLGVVTALGAAVAVAACGSAPRVAAGSASSGAADASTDARAPGPAGSSVTSSGPLPNIVAPPPITIVSSKRAEPQPRAGAEACVTSARDVSQREPPPREVDKLARACAAATKMKPAGAAMSGTQAATKPAAEFPFQAEAGRCYRVVFATSAAIRSVSVVVRDADGAVAAEEIASAPLGAAPRDGAVCFKAAERAVIVASVGEGEGAFALQLLEGDR